ncbi:DUF1778 domain-containing protein [Mesorhizobium sp. B1-1-8]|uniref:type II toxin -antitoxin system TacA 1-like antitoxin n=1 Tax=Mesorhizobium sp. B1-1-8 TaxID=2589976 RepID=UPI0011289C10|nr:DUF1778 domain-containing protein [Mesorhizobium sp. B1-1-8]UCI08175.1 DUF1778 domain-containing protein [Mesorhizobium sp. B1-1-8]
MKNDRKDELPSWETFTSRIEVPLEVYAEFLALLDAPPKSNEKLSKLMSAPLPWEGK